MSIIRIANPDEIRPGHVVMIVVIVLALAGSYLLTSGARSMILPDGAREWPADSLFRALVELLNFNYTQPTPTGSEIKDLVFGLGTAIAVLSVGIAVAARPRGGEDLDESDTVITDPAAQTHVEETPDKRHVQPLFAAQILMLVYVGWSFASIGWSDAQDIALYGSLELALYTLWPFALAYGLSRASARFGAYALAAVAAAAAAMALGYTHVRNPTLRASYPIGNPTFLAACLIPGLLIALCVLVSQVRDFGNPRRVRRVVIALVCIGVAVLIGFAFRRAHARGAQVGLVCGILALFFFAWRKRGKLVVLAVAVVCGALATWVLLPRMTDYSPTGRDASLRLRSYAWSYAVELVGEHGLRGHGQGGYVRKADVLASGEDVLNDPEALTARIAHAHNEWLEVWTGSGSGHAGVHVGRGGGRGAVHGVRDQALGANRPAGVADGADRGGDIRRRFAGDGFAARLLHRYRFDLGVFDAGPTECDPRPEPKRLDAGSERPDCSGARLCRGVSECP